ncbi:MAG: YggS family pyridoxal phosphate-dependent enzyme [Pseudomonadales bacterium]|nr:YggS family pyridoxal phosphate-dependent enzyme [Pseudomonadales bacterium]
MKSIAENIQIVTNDVEYLEQHYGRSNGSVSLIAASKTQSAERIAEACQAGVRNFGENYLQEALEKQQLLAEQEIIWHFIGPIQSRKARDVSIHFDWVHSVDRLVVAEKLSRFRPVEMEPLKVCIQVNIDNEANKSGVSEDQVEVLAEQINALPGLELRGLMCLPKPEQQLLQQRAPFRKLAQLLEKLQPSMPQIDTLSMGCLLYTSDAADEL